MSVVLRGESCKIFHLGVFPPYPLQTCACRGCLGGWISHDFIKPPSMTPEFLSFLCICGTFISATRVCHYSLAYADMLLSLSRYPLLRPGKGLTMVLKNVHAVQGCMASQPNRRVFQRHCVIEQGVTALI